MKITALDALEKRLRRRLAINVKRRRKELGLSLREAAARAGMRWTRWESIEQEEASVSLRTLKQLGQALEADPPQLLSAPRRPRR